VTATDLETDFLAELSLPNLEVLRHDVRIDEFPERTFDLIHARTVLMHLPERMATLRRVVSWLAPGGWLLVEDADFGMWMGDADPIWAAHPRAWHEAFPNGSLSHVIRANGHAVQYRDRGVAGDDHGGTTGSSKLGGHSCGGVSLASLRPVDVVDVASVQTGGSPLRRSFRKAGPNLPTHSSCGCSL
jgi:SAM-dependent methyltransferase